MSSLSITADIPPLPPTPTRIDLRVILTHVVTFTPYSPDGPHIFLSAWASELDAKQFVENYRRTTRYPNYTYHILPIHAIANHQ